MSRRISPIKRPLRGCLKGIRRIEFATTRNQVRLRGLIPNQGFVNLQRSAFL